MSKVYLVGGAVRDLLMGVTPKDKDYVVVGSSHRDMINKGFKQVGKDFPVYLHPITGEEYALARIERKTGKGYNGFEVETNNVTLEDDLLRRDITINAMAIEVGQPFKPENVIDPFNGKFDLSNKTIRHVSESFLEDPARGAFCGTI